MPTDWESHYRSGDTPWNKGEPSPGLVEFLREQPLRGRVLIPGCGLGHDVRAIAAAAKGHVDDVDDVDDGGVEVTGLDIAPSALKQARAFPPAGNERYELADFFALPPGLQGSFDWVWEHTCFCAIDPEWRERYVASVARALKPGGHFLAMFFLDPGLDPGESGPPFGVTPAELDALFSSSAGFERLHDWTPARTYPGREGRERMRLYRYAPGVAGAL